MKPKIGYTPMTRKKKITTWLVAAGVLLIGGFSLKIYLDQPYETTTIFPDESRRRPADTTFIVNGIKIKMIGINGGKIKCRHDNRAREMKDFYISETEVTQELWASVIGNNPSENTDSLLCPVECVNLVECSRFVKKLNSLTGTKFYIPTYPEWIYAAHLGYKNHNAPRYDDRTLNSESWYANNSDSTTHPVKQKQPNSLGIYDMIGNVAEWTIDGSDPLFFVMGSDYTTEKENCRIDAYDIIHAEIKMNSVGLRLVWYSKNPQE